MRILIMRFPWESVDRGGAENQTTWLATGLRRHGHTVSFVGSCSALLSMLQEEGCSVEALNVGPPPVTLLSAVSFLWRHVAMRRAMVAAVERAAPDAVLLLGLSEKILLTRLLARRGIRVLWAEHDRIGRWLTKNPWLPALRHASASATVVCVSELSARRYRALGMRNVVVIENGVPMDSEAPLPAQQRSGHPLLIGCVARLSPEKGVDVLLDAVRPLENVELTIVGSGPDHVAIARQIASMPSHKIRLLQRVDDLKGFYQSLDVLVLPSRDHDPFGLVVAEAMSDGIPVIVSDACGIAGSLRHGENALIVPAGDHRALTEALRQMCDPERRYAWAVAAYHAARERYGLGRMIAAYETYLASPPSTAVPPQPR